MRLLIRVPSRQVGVHIADATHFIPPGSALDVEAASRGNTFYLVNTRVNMIPPRLAEDLASLFAGKDRLAFSVIWEVDDEARILSMRFAKSVINSAASLSYSEAQAMIDDGACDTPLAKSLRLLQVTPRRRAVAAQWPHCSRRSRSRRRCRRST